MAETKLMCLECGGRGIVAQYLSRTQAAELIDRVRQLLVDPIHEVTVEAAIREMLVEQFCIPPLQKCNGEAHSNAFIDNCGSCMPRWGVTGKLLKVK